MYLHKLSRAISPSHETRYEQHQWQSIKLSESRLDSRGSNRVEWPLLANNDNNSLGGTCVWWARAMFQLIILAFFNQFVRYRFHIKQERLSRTQKHRVRGEVQIWLIQQAWSNWNFDGTKPPDRRRYSIALFLRVRKKNIKSNLLSSNWFMKRCNLFDFNCQVLF